MSEGRPKASPGGENETSESGGNAMNEPGVEPGDPAPVLDERSLTTPSLPPSISTNQALASTSNLLSDFPLSFDGEKTSEIGQIAASATPSNHTRRSSISTGSESMLPHSSALLNPSVPAALLHRPSLSKDRSNSNSSGVKGRHLVTFSGAKVVGEGAQTDEENTDDVNQPSSVSRARPDYGPRRSSVPLNAQSRFSGSHPSVAPGHSHSQSNGGRLRNPSLLLDIHSALRGATGAGSGVGQGSTSSDRVSPRSPDSPRSRTEPEFTGSALRRPMVPKHAAVSSRPAHLRRKSEPALTLPRRSMGSSVELNANTLTRAPSPISPIGPQNEPLLYGRGSMGSELSSGRRASAARNHPRYPSRHPYHPVTLFNDVKRRFTDSFAPALPSKTPFDFDFRVTAKPFVDALKYVFVGGNVKRERNLEPRRIFVNLEPEGEWADTHGGVKQNYSGNAVRTAKYSIVTFLPKNLLEQFRGLANFYFLALIILQTTPEFALVSPIITALPLLFIIVVTAVKDGIEDYNRHIQDNSLNESPTFTLYSNNAAEFTRLIMRGDIPEPDEKPLVDPSFNPPPASYTSTSKSTGGESRSHISVNREPPPLYINRNVPLVRIVTWGDLNPVTWLENLIWFLAYVTWFGWSEIRYFWQLFRSGGHKMDSTDSTVHDTVKQADVRVETLHSDKSPSSAEISTSNQESTSNGNNHVRASDTDDKHKNVEIDEDSTERRRMDGWGWAETMWQDVRVGDFVLLRNNNQIPADVLILATSEPEGSCYIETKNLDGETNLKIRRSPLPGLNYSITSAASCLNLKLRIDAEAPSVNMYQLTGSIESEGDEVEVADNHNPDQESPVTPSMLKVIDDSVDKKLQPPKFNPGAWGRGRSLDLGSLASRAGSAVNAETIRGHHLKTLSIGSRAALFSPVTLSQRGVEATSQASSRYPNPGGESSSPARLVPVSKTGFNLNNVLLRGCFLRNTGWVVGVVVYTGEDTKALYIYSDEFMRFFFPDDPPDAPGVACTPRSWNLSDDLGQIEYVFSDKTGTLTQNVMEFKRCSVAGTAYGTAPEVANDLLGITDLHVRTNEAKARAEAVKAMEELVPFSARKYVSSDAKYGDAQMWKDMMSNGIPLNWNLWEASVFGKDTDDFPDRHDDPTYLSRRLMMFWMHLAISHTVLVEKKPAVPSADGNSPTEKVVYQAQSPDESALVSAARDSGFTFLARKQAEILLDFMGTQLKYRVLQVIEFSSDRKRMSVVVQTDTGLILLLCKGADSVIFERLSGSDGLNPMHREMKLFFEDETLLHLEQFASEGLRTLCIAYRVISGDVYEAWAKKYREACAAMKDRDLLMERVASEIESQLTLLGATAIEDKLQDGVPETISKLMKANMKVWVLTGDKIETAINIAFSCALLSREQQLLVIKGANSVLAVRKVLLAGLRDVWDPEGDFALVIDGESLRHALDPSNQILLLELACRCRSVVCCRVSPLQKAQVVKLVRARLGAMCLSIGDGANDVSMIQEAHIGVGIVGREGMQAAMSADYSVGQFRYLQRLLLVHGRWCYMRTAEMVLGFFYKNIVLLFISFWFQFYCGFSAGDSLDFYYGMFYQTLFTFAPNFLLGVCDVDVNDRIALEVPYLYRLGIRQEDYTMERFWSYMGDGIYQSVIIFFFTLALFEDSATDAHGFVPDQTMMSGVFAWTVIINVNLFMMLNFKTWNWLILVGYLFTLGCWLAFCFVYWNVPGAPAYGMMFRLLGMPAFYFHYVLVTIVGFAPRYLYKFIREFFFPTDVGIFREIEKYHIRSPELHGVDVWSGSDLDDLAKARELRKLGLDYEISSGTWGQAGANPSLSEISMSASEEGAGENAVLPDRNRAQHSRRKSVSSMVNSKRMSSMVFLHQPDYEYAFTGFGFSQDEGTADIPVPQTIYGDVTAPVDLARNLDGSRPAESDKKVNTIASPSSSRPSSTAPGALSAGATPKGRSDDVNADDQELADQETINRVKSRISIYRRESALVDLVGVLRSQEPLPPILDPKNENSSYR
ncbi:hypothetical protein HDU93_002735 [Gonapodya sp. JEL0774]|nr:hypothetical protein HDU93_002735 [Gonapodya sp. JEL0774]